MLKRLITKDYEEIVLESFKIPETDFHNYYLNIVEEKYNYNKDIIANLKEAVNKWVTWYYYKIYGKSERIEMPDGTMSVENENQVWETDDKGNMTPIELGRFSITLLLDFGINKHVNKAFFDNLIDELNTIQEIINFKNSVIEFENKLYESLKDEMPKTIMPIGFDYKEIKKRFELLKQASILSKEKKVKPQIIDRIEDKEAEKEINIFHRTMELDIPRNHFKRLSTNNSKNGKPFLTETQLEDFIQKAFLGKKILSLKINFEDKEKLLVQSVFYEFYFKNCFNYFGTVQEQSKFIELLTNNFEGWDYKKLKGNFKPKTNKRLL